MVIPLSSVVLIHEYQTLEQCHNRRQPRAVVRRIANWLALSCFGSLPSIVLGGSGSERVARSPPHARASKFLSHAFVFDLEDILAFAVFGVHFWHRLLAASQHTCAQKQRRAQAGRGGDTALNRCHGNLIVITRRPRWQGEFQTGWRFHAVAPLPSLFIWLA
jgi:hypothetical protein